MSRLTNHFDYCDFANCKWKDTELAKVNQCNFFNVTSRDRCHDKQLYERLRYYEDLEEQGRLIDWRKTSEEKPDSTRHLIVAYGEIISHYGYYLKPKDKWFTDWTCEKEMDAPMFWADMPDPPEESLHNDCGAKMDEVEND